MQYLSRAELIDEMKSIALLEGDFTLRSGQKSRWYFDKYRFEGQPRIMHSVAHHMSRLIPADTHRLAGVELGGIPMVTALSMYADIPCVFIRKKAKDYGTAAQVEGSYEKTDRLLIIEDVVTTGGQVIEMLKDMREQGFNIIGCMSVLNRKQGADEAFEKESIPYWSLFSRDDFGF
jgi:orotate phosphoribosyltransferase